MKIFFILLAWVTVSGCYQQNTTPVSPTLPVTPVSYTLAPTARPTFRSASPSPPVFTPEPTATPPGIASPTSDSIATPTMIIAPAATTWATFTYTSSPAISIQYPVEWTIEAPSGGNRSIVFKPTQQMGYQVIFEVYHRPLEDRSIADPYTWANNDGPYLIAWEKPLEIDNARGKMFVWTVDYSLWALYYSEKYELDIRLVTSMDKDVLMMAETHGFTETITQQFQVFEHMANSVQIITSE